MKIGNLLKIGVFFTWHLYSCQSSNGDPDKLPEELDTARTQPSEVEIVVLMAESFRNEILTNGKLIASQKAVLRFRTSGVINTLYIQNGDQVRKGGQLVLLDTDELTHLVSQKEVFEKKARLQFEDVLVGRGYDANSLNTIPEKVLEIAGVRSGFIEARQELSAARLALKSANLYAPFEGKVADLKLRQYEHIAAGTEVATLINDAFFEVEFKISEDEIDKIKIAGSVEIMPFHSNKSYKGKIKTINPKVEKDGTLTVTAELKNDGSLVDGMNVRVVIENLISRSLVVPKNAIVLRQNQEVTFKYQNGRARWTYVKTIHENSNAFAIVADHLKSGASISEGDTIIISGNLNLSDDSEVSIRK